jgi:ABC-2 type transport system permease protein
MTAPSNSHPGPRIFGAVNWRGFWTLYVKEVRRFLNVATQTIVAPMITTLLFLAIFTLALGGRARAPGDVPYDLFLAPGLMMMAMVQNAFANTSSSILISKVQGNIVDVLMPPLSPLEMTMGYVMGGVTRGLLVGCSVALAMWVFVPLSLPHPLAALYFAFMASLMLSLIGMLGGIWADKFDHIAALTNFVIMPFAFLSGTFYSIERLPGVWYEVAHLNPFFYMIDGLRYGFIDRADGDPLLGALVLLAINGALALACYRAVKTGWRLKA